MNILKMRGFTAQAEILGKAVEVKWNGKGKLVLRDLKLSDVHAILGKLATHSVDMDDGTTLPIAEQAAPDEENLESNDESPPKPKATRKPKAAKVPTASKAKTGRTQTAKPNKAEPPREDDSDGDCVACGGSGRNSKGAECRPCKGTGLKSRPSEQPPTKFSKPPKAETPTIPEDASPEDIVAAARAAAGGDKTDSEVAASMREELEHPSQHELAGDDLCSECGEELGTNDGSCKECTAYEDKGRAITARVRSHRSNGNGDADADGTPEKPHARPRVPEADDPLAPEGGVPEELATAVRLRQVLSYMMKHGITKEADLIAECERLKSQVPVLSRIASLPDRVKRTIAGMEIVD